MPKKLENMEEEELEALLQKLDAEREEIAGKMLEVNAERDRRAMLDKLAAMTDSEREQLRQALSAEGIGSAEAVNGQES